MTKFEFPLPSFVFSYEQVDLVIQEIEELRAHLVQKIAQSQYGSVEGKKVVLDKNLSPALKEYLLSLASFHDLNQELLEKLLIFFEDVKKKAPQFHIVLADIPDDEMKERLVSWFRKNIHLHALISFAYTREILGGAVLRTRNIVYDFSFGKVLQKPKLMPFNLVRYGRK